MKELHDLIVEIVYGSFELFMGGIEHAVLVLQADLSSNATIGGTIQKVQDCMQGVSYAIMTILFMLELVELLKKEDVSERDVYRIIMQLGITRMIIYYAPQFLNLIYMTGSFWIAQIDVAVIDDTILESIKENISDTVPMATGGLWSNIVTIVKQLLSFIKFLPNMIVMFVAYVAIEAMAYARNIEIVVLTAVSSLPLCFIPYSGTKEITKKFILLYAAVCMQGVMMVIGIGIVVSLLSITTGIWNITVVTVVLCLVISKTGTWAKETLGLG